MQFHGRRAVRAVGAVAAVLALVLVTVRPGAEAKPAPVPPGDAKPAPVWANDFTARLEALAVLETLNAELLSHDSATLTLDRWCDAHHLASPAKVIAVRDRDANKEPTADQRKALGVSATEPIRYRRVRLVCGAHVLTEADNWYVPSRLTPDMNHQLETSDIAFGRAVQALHFQRRTLSAKLLWSPLPDGWDIAGGVLPDATAKTLQVPHAVLEHQAVLTLPDGTAISQVIETYTEQGAINVVLEHQAVLTLPDGTAISQVIETYTEQVLGFPQPRPMR